MFFHATDTRAFSRSIIILSLVVSRSYDLTTFVGAPPADWQFKRRRVSSNCSRKGSSSKERLSQKWWVKVVGRPTIREKNILKLCRLYFFLASKDSYKNLPLETVNKIISQRFLEFAQILKSRSFKSSMILTTVGIIALCCRNLDEKSNLNGDFFTRDWWTEITNKKKKKKEMIFRTSRNSCTIKIGNIRWIHGASTVAASR